MKIRGLVVLGSYDPSERDIEAHFYFPWISVDWKRFTTKTSKFAHHGNMKLKKCGTYQEELDR